MSEFLYVPKTFDGMPLRYGVIKTNVNKPGIKVLSALLFDEQDAADFIAFKNGVVDDNIASLLGENNG